MSMSEVEGEFRNETDGDLQTLTCEKAPLKTVGYRPDKSPTCSVEGEVVASGLRSRPRDAQAKMQSQQWVHLCG